MSICDDQKFAHSPSDGAVVLYRGRDFARRELFWLLNFNDRLDSSKREKYDAIGFSSFFVNSELCPDELAFFELGQGCAAQR